MFLIRLNFTNIRQAITKKKNKFVVLFVIFKFLMSLNRINLIYRYLCIHIQYIKDNTN